MSDPGDPGQALRAYVAQLPRRPGVYRMYDAEGTLIYIGKASSLRDRVGSYFSKSGQAPKVAAMVRRIARIEVTLVNSETEALLLECTLIKAHHPRYNILMRDDKTFPYILIPEGHPFPRLVYHRTPRRPVGRVFGPFPNAQAARTVLQQLQKTFKLRNCRDAFFANRSRPCLQYQIGRCSAPCVGFIDVEDYGRDVAAAIAVLEGRSAEVADGWRRQMEARSAELDFEAAALLRDRLADLQAVQSQQLTNTRAQGDRDVIALAGEPGQYAICVLPVREGSTLGTATHFPASSIAERGEALSAFIMLYYSTTAVPPEIVVGEQLEDCASLAAALSSRAGRQVQVRVAQRGLGRKWVAMALANAEQALQQHVARHDQIELALQSLADALSLPGPPARVECFDISHTMGEGTVASCVVYGAEGALKRDYRRFNIEDVAAGDDYGAIHQALLRHARRIVSGERPRPDLLLIDGGAGQLQAAVAALAQAGLHDVPIFGVSKGADRRPGQERLHRVDGGVLTLPPDSPALHLIQRVRDEAHRFAITAHRKRRAQRFRESILETIPGLGPSRRRSLLGHFGGLQGVLKAPMADLAAAPGIGAALATSIYDHLHPGVR
ncbi:MAG TPA: excinuclease ABC subunit UvrC [Steroidobacteraceae bacterium]|nr:excinuclease ABC subunit UvrC [Steroidobacteraceae bacterium]